MSSFHIAIVTPQGKIFEGEGQSVIAPGVDGFFEVLANHTPVVIALKHSTVTLRRDGKISYFIVGSGVLEVNQKHDVLILVDSAVSVGDLREAYEKLKNDNYSSIFENV